MSINVDSTTVSDEHACTTLYAIGHVSLYGIVDRSNYLLLLNIWNVYFSSLEDLDAKVRERYSGSKKQQQQQQREGEVPHFATEVTFTKSPRDSPTAKLSLAVGETTHGHNIAEEESSSTKGSNK